MATSQIPDAPSQTAAHRTTAGVALFVAALAWGLAPVFIRYLSHDYDPYSQMLIRYGSGTAALTVLCLVSFRAEFLRTLRRSKAILPLALVTVTHQYTWTSGTYGSTATVAQLLTKLSVALVIVFSFALFHEERSVIKSPLYLLGTALSLVGVAGVLTKDPQSLVPGLDKASILLLMTAVLWSVYVVWAKHLVTDIHPVPMFTVLAIWTTLGFAVLAVLLGDVHTLVTAGPRMTAIAVLSGLIPIATAHPSYHFAQKHLGAAFCSSVILVNPLFTYAVALMFWADERLRPTQWAGAAILLAGTVLVTLAGQRKR